MPSGYLTRLLDCAATPSAEVWIAAEDSPASAAGWPSAELVTPGDPMKRTSSVLVAAAALGALASLSGCGSDAPVAAAAAVPAPSASSAAAVAANGCPTDAPSSVAVPVRDAKATRDALLGAACSAPFGSDYASTTITDQWQKLAPGLTTGLFSDSLADPTTLSAPSSFSLDAGSTYDQLFAFAVSDGTSCAGGVVVIPQGADGQASDSRTPTVFQAVDVPAGTDCSAAGAQKIYRPGSVRS